MNIKELAYWNHNAYGKALKIKKKYLISAGIVFCVLTPCTNWAIPFLKKIIKTDLIFRY